MSYLSRLIRNRKRRERPLTSAQRRRKLVVEPLEDRRLLTVTASFAAGVLTFTGDPNPLIADKVVIESTGTAGTINYNGGLGSIAQAGVKSVVFNAGAGDNDFFIINKSPSTFQPPAVDSFFDVFFNVDLDGIGGDRLRMVGGSAATILSGSYTVASPNSGTITYSTSAKPINITFSGFDVGTVDEVDDETIQAGSFVTNSSTGAENVTVKVGPVLTSVQSFTQGPVFIDGGDRDDHGFFSGGNQNGWKFIQQAVQFVRTGSFIPGTTKDVLIVGANGSTASAAIASALGVLGYTSDTVIAPGPGPLQIGGVNFSNYKLIYVPSDGDTAGGITAPQNAALALRKADIQTYVQNGGGIVALTEELFGASAYAWLEIPAPFTIGSPIDFTNMIQQPALTTAFAALGLSITNAELTAGTPVHNTFTGPAGFNGLDVFVLNPNNQVITLGQGPINQTIGGGPTTQISGNQMTGVNLGNKPALTLDAKAGTDAILVDGTVFSLDGLLAPLTVNGGNNNDSLSITDSADAVGDAVSVTSTGTTGLAAFPITYSGIGSLSVQATQGADTMTVDVSPAAPGLTSVTVLGGLSGDLFTGPTGYVRPSSTISLNVHGGIAAATPGPGVPFNGFAEAGDKFNLDMTNKKDGAVVTAVTPVVIVDTNGGNAISTNTQLVRFTGIEDIDVLEGGVLTNTAIGDFYLRATPGPDYIEFRSAAQVDPTFRVRVGNVYYPSSTGNFGPYTTATGKAYVYGRDGNDTITMYNTRLDGVIFGEGGDDVLTGGYGNDLLIGGSGNDRINGGVVGGNDEIWGDDFDPVVDGASIAARSLASQTGIGNDQINTFGGSDTVYGQGGADIINTGLGADYINGGPGNDLIDGQGGDDRIYAGTGNDTASGADGNDLVAGNGGDDTLYGRVGNDILIGGDGVDIVSGHEGGDALIGDDSNNAGGSNSLAKGDISDAALLAVLNAWKLSPVLLSLSGLASSGTDSDTDTLWGGSEADAFFATGLDVMADRVVGTDLN